MSQDIKISSKVLVNKMCIYSKLIRVNFITICDGTTNMSIKNRKWSVFSLTEIVCNKDYDFLNALDFGEWFWRYAY